MTKIKSNNQSIPESKQNIIDKNKFQIIELLRSTGRKNIENLIDYLLESDFFIAPASTKFHNCFMGGLAKHCLDVYYIFKEKCEKYNINIPFDSIIITGLQHDNCKIACYIISEEEATISQMRYIAKLTDQNSENLIGIIKNKSHASAVIEHLLKKQDKKIIEAKNNYNYNDNYPIGHGEKSVIILQKYIELTEQEIMLIRFHMNIFNDDVKLINQAVKLYPECILLFTADYETAGFL